MNKYLVDFVHEHDHLDDTLLIVYYAGHGWALPGGRGELHLAGLATPGLTILTRRILTLALVTLSLT